MGRLQPAAAGLAEALEGAAAAPLDRAGLLRGTGWELLFLELTARCNEACLHCYAESSPAREESLPLATVLAALEEARALGFRQVQLTGGDPLLAPTLQPAAERALALGLAVEVYTNGLALQGALWEALRPLPLSWAFSFHSSDPAVHDAITATPGSQLRTLAALRRVGEAGRPLRVGVVVGERNAADLPATLALLRDELGLGPEQVHVSGELAVGRGRAGPLLPAVAGRGPDPAHGGRRAGAGLGGKAAVLADGTVAPCIFARRIALGRLGERSLAGILSDPRPLPGHSQPLLDAAEAWSAALSCRECRLRAAGLVGAP